jgi:hypothetical protein
LSTILQRTLERKLSTTEDIEDTVVAGYADFASSVSVRWTTALVSGTL